MSNFNFNPQFKKQVATIAQELGLIENTTPRQAARGTISYVDPVASSQDVMVGYSLHESGYIRRFTRYVGGTNTLRPRFSHYQLNRQEREEVRGFLSNALVGYTTERIPASPLEQLGILSVSVFNYRK